MEELGTRDILQVVEDVYELSDIMSVDGPEIAEVEGFEQIAAAADKAFYAVFDLAGYLPAEMAADGQFAEGLPNIILELVVGLGGGNIGEIFLQGAYVGVDAHAIVIQDDEQVGIGDTGVVHAFEGQAGGHGAISDDGYGLAIHLPLIFSGHSHAKGGADGGGGMAYPKCIILTFRASWKSTQPIVLSVGTEIIPAACEDLVAIGLVSYVPYELVVGGIEDVVKGYGEFDDAQAGCKVASMNAHGIDDILTEFVTDLL